MMITKGYIKQYKAIALSLLCLMLMFSSCFTGVEGTRKISEKDVAKLGAESKEQASSSIDTLSTSNIKTWKVGKKFFVTDKQIQLVLGAAAEGNLDKGDTITYISHKEENIYGTNPNLILVFKGKNDKIYTYNTNKQLNDAGNLIVPFTVDLDIVNIARKLLIGNELYVNTSLWYNNAEDVISGLKFVKVNIIDVLPGNKVYSLKVKFAHEGKNAYVFVSTKDNSVQNRSFENLFSTIDPHKNYASITDKNWNLIIKGKVAQGMTKDECRLSLGAPNNIDKVPTYSGLKEFWQYEDGTYLIFMDGLLDTFRK